jgi:uncharacterized protein with GYD domain
MPLFVILGNFTQKRMMTIRNLQEQVKTGVNLFESLGIEIKSLVFTMGRYDMAESVKHPIKRRLQRLF